MFKWFFGNNNKNNKINRKKIISLDDSFFTIDNREIKLKENNLFSKEKIIIIKIGTDSCPACKMFSDPLKNFEMNNNEYIETYELNISHFPELSNKLNIRSVPTNLIFKDNTLINIAIGADLNNIAQIIKGVGIVIK